MIYYAMHSWNNTDPMLTREIGSLSEIVEKLEAEFYRAHDYTVHVFDNDMTMVAIIEGDEDADWDDTDACITKTLENNWQ